MIAQTKSNHVGNTFFTGSGWYKFKSEHKKGLRIGLTKYFNINHVINIITSDTPSKINFINEIGFKTDGLLEYKRK